jgi:hypothetical protein
MSGGGSSSSSYDPAQLGRTLGNKLESYVKTPVPVFNKELYTGQGATTQGALGSILGNANPGGFSGHINSAIGDFGDIASGKRFGMDDPGYAQLRSKLGSDTLRDVNAIFTGSGRFGSGSHVDTATSSLGNVLAGLDYGNFQNDQQRQFAAAGMLPQLYSASQMPGQTQLAVGQLQDADSLTARRTPTTTASRNCCKRSRGRSRTPGCRSSRASFRCSLAASAPPPALH